MDELVVLTRRIRQIFAAEQLDIVRHVLARPPRPHPLRRHGGELEDLDTYRLHLGSALAKSASDAHVLLGPPMALLAAVPIVVTQPTPDKYPIAHLAITRIHDGKPDVDVITLPKEMCHELVEEVLPVLLRHENGEFESGSKATPAWRAVRLASPPA